MIGDGQNAARKVVVFRPKVEQRFSGSAAHFPGEASERREAAAIFVYLDGAISREFFKACLQFSRKVHAADYKVLYVALRLFFPRSKQNARDANRRFLDVPGGRNVFERDLEVAGGSWS
jgi:hypothetical protein